MEEIKQLLFKLMSQNLSLNDFENWLYTDDYIKSQLLENEMIFELVSINLRSKHAIKELEKCRRACSDVRTAAHRKWVTQTLPQEVAVLVCGRH